MLGNRISNALPVELEYQVGNITQERRSNSEVLAFPSSTVLARAMIQVQFFSQIIRQKSFTVSSVGPT
jgi:hypothetical protein